MRNLLQALQWLLEMVFWAVAGTIVLALLAFFFHLGMGSFFGVLAPFFALFVLLSAARVQGRGRRRRALLLVGYVEQALRLNLPLPRMLEAAARGERGATSDRLNEVKAAVATGWDVSDALAENVPELAWRETEQLKSAERLGRLPAAMARLRERLRRRTQQTWGDPMLGMSYGVVVVLFMVMVLGFLTALILPKLIEVFEDFDTQLPWVTQLTFDAAQKSGWVLLILGVGSTAALAGYGLWVLVQGVTGRRPLFAGLWDGIAWRLPLLGRVVRSRAWSDGCMMVGEGLRSGLSLHEAAAEAGNGGINATAKRRFMRWSDLLASGEPAGSAAAEAGLPGVMAGMVGSVERVSEPAEVFAFLEGYYADRGGARASLLRASVMPTIVVVLGLVTGWIVLSMFLPLVRLIEAVMPYTEVM